MIEEDLGIKIGPEGLGEAPVNGNGRSREKLPEVVLWEARSDDRDLTPGVGGIASEASLPVGPEEIGESLLSDLQERAGEYGGVVSATSFARKDGTVATRTIDKAREGFVLPMVEELEEECNGDYLRMKNSISAARRQVTAAKKSQEMTVEEVAANRALLNSIEFYTTQAAYEDFLNSATPGYDGEGLSFRELAQSVGRVKRVMEKSSGGKVNVFEVASKAREEQELPATAKELAGEIALEIAAAMPKEPLRWESSTPGVASEMEARLPIACEASLQAEPPKMQSIKKSYKLTESARKEAARVYQRMYKRAAYDYGTYKDALGLAYSELKEALGEGEVNNEVRAALRMVQSLRGRLVTDAHSAFSQRYVDPREIKGGVVSIIAQAQAIREEVEERDEREVDIYAEATKEVEEQLRDSWWEQREPARLRLRDVAAAVIPVEKEVTVAEVETFLTSGDPVSVTLNQSADASGSRQAPGVGEAPEARLPIACEASPPENESKWRRVWKARAAKKVRPAVELGIVGGGLALVGIGGVDHFVGWDRINPRSLWERFVGARAGVAQMAPEEVRRTQARFADRLAQIQEGQNNPISTPTPAPKSSPQEPVAVNETEPASKQNRVGQLQTAAAEVLQEGREAVNSLEDRVEVRTGKLSSMIKSRFSAVKRRVVDWQDMVGKRLRKAAKKVQAVKSGEQQIVIPRSIEEAGMEAMELEEKYGPQAREMATGIVREGFAAFREGYSGPELVRDVGEGVERLREFWVEKMGERQDDNEDGRPTPAAVPQTGVGEEGLTSGDPIPVTADVERVGDPVSMAPDVEEDIEVDGESTAQEVPPEAGNPAVELTQEEILALLDIFESPSSTVRIKSSEDAHNFDACEEEGQFCAGTYLVMPDEEGKWPKGARNKAPMAFLPDLYDSGGEQVTRAGVDIYMYLENIPARYQDRLKYKGQLTISLARSVGVGDVIEIVTGNGVYKYIITEKFTVSPDSPFVEMLQPVEPDGPPTLTISNCGEPEDGGSNLNIPRVVVRAVMQVE